MILSSFLGLNFIVTVITQSSSKTYIIPNYWQLPEQIMQNNIRKNNSQDSIAERMNFLSLLTGPRFSE